MYDYLIVTSLPVFYKINLYNAINSRLNVFVIFIANDGKEKRADDFITLDKCEFDYEVLCNGELENANAIFNILKINSILKKIKYKKLLIGGWDFYEYWYLIFKTPKYKNCLDLESGINESFGGFLKRLLKKIFLTRISIVFASGSKQSQLAKSLGFSNKIITSYGVGIINKPKIQKQNKKFSKKFLFVGRLVDIKNIEFLIKVFNDLPDCKLGIIGCGKSSYEKYLKSLAKKNINFIGQVPNAKLDKYFYEYDMFILPSLVEPWGLVVQEALYFGMGVIVSNCCGVSDLIQDGKNGYIINPKDSKELKKIIQNLDVDKYNNLIKNSNLDDDYDKAQVKAYIKAI